MEDDLGTRLINQQLGEIQLLQAYLVSGEIKHEKYDTPIYSTSQMSFISKNHPSFVFCSVVKVCFLESFLFWHVEFFSY